jgi:hypothetical protein
MADYACTVTFDLPNAKKVFKGLGISCGKADITNYNQTGAEITDLTGEFKTLLRIICDGISDNGYIVRWNTTDKCFHAFYPTIEHDHNLTIIGGTAAAGTDTVNVKSLVLGKEEAANVTVLGADNATKGGVVQNSAAAGSEVADDVDVGEVNFIAIGLI